MISAFLLSATAVGITATAGSNYTRQSVGTPWYSNIRPWFAPPNWVFPIVWTILYIALAVAFGLSILHDTALVIILHVLNLGLNVAWCRAFFGKKELRGALGIIVGNLAVALGIALQTRKSTVMYLVLPYILWLSFATLLNHAAIQKSEARAL